jgi:hypothetical protein
MKNIFKIALTIILTYYLGICTYAQEPTSKDIKKAFAPKGTHRAPFKNQNEVALTSVNLQFKFATRQEKTKRQVGNVVTWGFLEGIDDHLLQEISNEYYKNLSSKFQKIGITLNESYKTHKSYQKLVDDNASNNRETSKKNWGVAKIFTAKQDHYIEFPLGRMGAHASLGNDLKIPVGQIFITVDFLEIVENIERGMTKYTLTEITRTDKFESEMQPVIRIEGVTAASLGKQFKGDGTYAKFTGNNWSYSNAILNNDFIITSSIPFANDVETINGMPTSMKKFKSDVIGDLATIFSKGTVKSGRGTLETSFIVNANPEAYQKAVLDALDKYNDYLIEYIKANN